MKILDRYIIRNFLSTFIVSMGLILTIAVVFDVSEKIEDFVSKGASIREIFFDHYLNFLVFYGNLFSSMIVFIATIFFTSRLTARTEIVAILTGGVSFNRLLWPYFISASIVASFSFFLSHYVIPHTNQIRLAFEWRYILNKKQDRFQNIHKQIQPGHVIFMSNYNAERFSGYQFHYEHYEGQKLVSKLKSDFIRFDTIKQIWRLDNVVIRHLNVDGSEQLQTQRKLDTNLLMKPSDISTIVYNSEMMTTPELDLFISAEKARGSETVNFFLIEKYKRTSWPASTYILVLIALALSSKKTRGGLGLNIALGLTFCVAYIFFMQISTTFATLGNFPPLLAVWLPNLIFAGLAAYLYAIAPK